MEKVKLVKIFILTCLSVFFTYYPGVTDGAVTLNKHRKLVVFSFDGFRPDYLTKANMPILFALKAAGVTTPYMKPQFPTKTFTNHQSIATGLYAESHGIVDNAGYDPLYDSVVSNAHGDTFWHYSDKVRPIWLLNEMAGDGRVSAAQFPGCEIGYGPNWTKIRHYLNYKNKQARPYKERIDIVINWLTNATRPANLVFMYFNEPDAQGQLHGPNSSKVKAALGELDSTVAYFFRKLNQLGIRDEINLVILSDHGMEQVKKKNVIRFGKLTDPKITFMRCGSSPLFQIWPNEKDVATLYAQFLYASKTQPFSVYKKNELPARWHYMRTRRVAPILLLANNGFKFYEKRGELCQSSDVYARDEEVTDPEAVEGIHGYDNGDPSMQAFFFAIGPSFKNGVSVQPFQNIDLFSMICKIIDIPPPPNNGTINNLLPALIF